MLSDLIDHDQTGFLKGRSIAENICLISNVISYTHLKDISGLLLFIDFEKAFDTIEWTFLRKTLEHFGFCSSLINSINFFYSDIQSCIINNGWSGSFLSLGRGVDKEIKGISVGNIECILSQYTDDTTMILDDSQASLERSFALLDSFCQLSGLGVNCGKTEVLWIGSKKGSNQIMCPEKNLKWADGKVKMFE